MLIRVLFFGALADVAGTKTKSVELNDGATVADLLRLIVEREPQMARYAGSIAVSVNQEYALRNLALHQDDEVGLLPPVSGGADTAPDALRRRAFLVREKIDSAKVIDGTKAAADGGVVVFEGVVRDNSRGRTTIYLEYEAYEEMAVRELEKLAEQAVKDFAIRDAVVIHRLGQLYVGETSVLIVIASAHRAAAFDACRWFIDTLKKTVPIWKKEYFVDGAVWADGEPFPAELGTAKP
jgi:MoaE-MoaD fusion protein